MRYLVVLGRLFYSLIFVVAGFGAFLHANGNGPAQPRFPWRAGSLIRNCDGELSRSALSL